MADRREIAHRRGVGKLRRRELAHDRPFLDQQHAIRQGLDEVDVLLDQEDGEAALAAAAAAACSMISSTIEGWMPSVGSSSRTKPGLGRRGSAPGPGAAARRRTARRPGDRAAARGAGTRRGWPRWRRRSPPACRGSPCAGSRAPSGPGRSRGPAARSRCRSRARRWVGARVIVARRRTGFAGGGRQMPISARSSVVLPMPLWPRMPTNSPPRTCEGDPVEDRDAAVAGPQSLDFEHVRPRRLLAEIDVAHHRVCDARASTCPRSGSRPGGTPSPARDHADELHVVLDDDEAWRAG